jgi:hypothetical protein
MVQEIPGQARDDSIQELYNVVKKNATIKYCHSHCHPGLDPGSPAAEKFIWAFEEVPKLFKNPYKHYAIKESC